MVLKILNEEWNVGGNQTLIYGGENPCPLTDLTFHKKENWFPLFSSPQYGDSTVYVIQKSLCILLKCQERYY